MKSSTQKILHKYGLPFLAALALKFAFIPILPDLMKGVGGQIFPAYVARIYGPKHPSLDTAACPKDLENFNSIAYYNPDFSSYYYFHIEILKCLIQGKPAPLLCCIRSTLKQNFRLPGYGTIYVVLWALSRDKSIAREWLVILQILLAAVAAALFGDLISNLTQKEVLRIPTTLVYASLPFVVRYEYVLGSEGIYHSFLTFSIWTLYKSYLRNNKMLILSGVFLTMAYNIRPLTIVMFPAFLLYILLISIDSPWKKVTSFLSSLILFESIWIPINYFVYRKPYITLKYHFAPGIDSTEWWRISELLRSVGDNYYWFYYSSYKLPQRAYTSDFGPREEKHLVALLKGYYADSIPEIAVVRYALAWEQSIKREKPFLYYILSRFYSTMNFLTSHLQEHVVYTPFWRVGGIHAIIYLYSTVIWSVVIGGGLILSLYYLLKWRDYPFMAFLGLSGNIGWAAYAALGLIQSRYILMGLVFLMALVTAAIGRIKSDISPNHR